MSLRSSLMLGGVTGAFAFTIACLLFLPRIAELKEERNQAIEFASRDSIVAQIYRNNWQRETAKTKTTEMNFHNLEDLITTQELSWIRQFDGVKNNLKNLDVAFRSNVEIDQSLKLKARDTVLFANSDVSDAHRGMVSSDSVHALSFNYHNQYNTIEGLVVADSVKITRLQISVPLDGVVYWQRRKFLGLRIGRKDYFSEISSANDWVKVKNMEYIKIQKR